MRGRGGGREKEKKINLASELLRAIQNTRIKCRVLEANLTG